MTACTHCGGGVLADGNGDNTCAICARPASQVGATTQSNGVITIDIQVRPGNFAELFNALALTSAKSAPEFLQEIGLAPREATRMARGEVIYPAALVTLCETYAITPAQVMSLMKRQPKPMTRTKPGPKPRKQARTRPND